MWRSSDLCAIILAGGRGTRMGQCKNKVLTPIHGKTIIARLIDHLRAQGVPNQKIVVCTGYGWESVRDAVAPIHTCNAGLRAKMCRRIMQAVCHDFGGDFVLQPLLICYGDELADIDLGALLEYHCRRGYAATITTYHRLVPFGVVGIDSMDHALAGICSDVRMLANIGFAVVERKALNRMSPTDDFADFISQVADDPLTRVGAYLHPGREATVNTQADVAEAERVFTS